MKSPLPPGSGLRIPAPRKVTVGVSEQLRTEGPVDGIPLIDFTHGMPGYPDARSFVLERMDELGALFTLRSVDGADPTFLVIAPGVWFPAYEPVLDAQTCHGLDLTDAAEALVLLVVTMGTRPEDATANLLAPLVVNARTRQGAQVVLSGTAYSVREPLHAA